MSNGTGSSDTGPASKYAYGLPLHQRAPAGRVVIRGGGNSVVINGYGFTGTASSMSVMFGRSPGDHNEHQHLAGGRPRDADRREQARLHEDHRDRASAGQRRPVDVTVTTAAGTSNPAAPGSDAEYHYGIPTVTASTPAPGRRRRQLRRDHRNDFGAGSTVWFGDSNQGQPAQRDRRQPHSVDRDRSQRSRQSDRRYLRLDAAGSSVATNAE